MKTGRLIYNASYCIGLVLQVKDNKMSLDDVMMVLDKDYQTWYTTYWAPITDINKKAKDAQALAYYDRYEEALAKQKQFISEAEYYAKIYKENELAYIAANREYKYNRGQLGGIQKAINEILRENAKGKVLLYRGVYEFEDSRGYTYPKRIKKEREWVNQNLLSAETYDMILDQAVANFNELLEDRELALSEAKTNFKAATIARDQAYDALNISRGRNEQAALAAKDADYYINQYNKLKKETIEYQLYRLFLSF